MKKEGKKPVKKKAAPKKKVHEKKSRKGEEHKGNLNERQWRFCHEYILCGRKVKAAISAGYSKRSARAQVVELMKNPNIVEKINKLKAANAKKYEVTKENIINELSKLAFTNLTDITDISEGKAILKDLDSIPNEALATIKSLRNTRFGIAIKGHDKNKALEDLAKHLNLFKDDNKREVEITAKLSDKDRDEVKQFLKDLKSDD